jgi:hypothetical protein
MVMSVRAQVGNQSLGMLWDKRFIIGIDLAHLKGEKNWGSERGH